MSSLYKPSTTADNIYFEASTYLVAPTLSRAEYNLIMHLRRIEHASLILIQVGGDGDPKAIIWVVDNQMQKL